MSKGCSVLRLWVLKQCCGDILKVAAEKLAANLKKAEQVKREAMLKRTEQYYKEYAQMEADVL